MKRYFLACLILIGFFAFSSHFSSWADQPWKPFVSKEGKFSILMPAPPSFTKTQHKSFVGTIEENTFRSKSNSESFNVEYSDLPRTALFLTGSDTIFEETKEGVLNNSRGIQLQFRSLVFQGNPGKFLMFKIPPQKNEEEMIGKAYFYLVNQRLYVIIGIAPRAASSNIIDQFLNSFKVF